MQEQHKRYSIIAAGVLSVIGVTYYLCKYTNKVCPYFNSTKSSPQPKLDEKVEQVVATEEKNNESEATLQQELQ